VKGELELELELELVLELEWEREQLRGRILIERVARKRFRLNRLCRPRRRQDKDGLRLIRNWGKVRRKSRGYREIKTSFVEEGSGIAVVEVEVEVEVKMEVEVEVKVELEVEVEVGEDEGFCSEESEVWGF
jgi:hypothetical protein